MAFFEIVISPSSNTVYKNIDIDGTFYDMEIRYLQRMTNISNGKKIKADEFILNLSLAGRPPFLSTSLKTNRDVLAPYRYKEECPKGTLMLYDFIALKSLYLDDIYMPERVSYEELGNRFILTYDSPR